MDEVTVKIISFVINPVVINTTGLGLDIAGAVLLWRFGLPADISRSGSVFLILEQGNEEEKNKAENYDKWARGGILALITGFVLQAISNFL